MEFTDWATFEKIDDAPKSMGVFQVRIDKGLLDYPTGKSTMYYYAYAENLHLNIIEFTKTILPHLSIPQNKLLVRWLPVSDAKTRFEQRMNAFINRFSIMPLGNEEWYKQVKNVEG